MSSAKSESFASSFPIWITFCFYSSLIPIARTSKTMLHNSGESGHSCLAPDLKGNAVIFSPLRIMFAVGLSYMAFLCWGMFLLLEKEMATCFSILIWRIPWTEEPGKPQSMVLQKVRSDYVTSTSFHFMFLLWASLVVLVVKNLSANARDIRDAGLIPWSRWSPGGGHGNPLQCSCLENPMDRGTLWATIYGVAKSWTQLNGHSMFILWPFFEEFL